MAPSEIHGGISFIQNILKEKENPVLFLIDMVVFNVLIKQVITVVWFFFLQNVFKTRFCSLQKLVCLEKTEELFQNQALPRIMDSKLSFVPRRK